MYQAICPSCGHIQSVAVPPPVPATLWRVCARCGMASTMALQPLAAPVSPNTMTASPPQPQPFTKFQHLHPGALGPAFQSFTTLDPTAGDGEEAEVSERDRWLAALREQVYALAADVCAEARGVSDAEMALGLAAAYHRIQDAHAALYRALGGSHMGEYAPGRVDVDRALATLWLWLMAVRQAAERMRDGEA